MTAIVRVRAGNDYRDFIESQFPLAVGAREEGVITFGDSAESAPVAWLGYASGHVFIEPVVGTATLKINNIAISRSVWLTDEDRIQLGETLIEVSESAGVIVLTPNNPRSGPQLTPPARPPTPRPADRLQAESHPPHQADAAHTEPAGVAGSGLPAAPNPAQPSPPIQSGNPAGNQVSDPFLPTAPASTPASRPWHRRLLVSLLVLAVLGAGFVLFATPVQVTVTPEPEAMTFTGLLPAIKVGERFLVLAGTYQLSAKKKGFRELNQSIQVASGTKPELAFRLRKLPGYLTITTDPDQGVQILIDGQQASAEPLERFEIEAGPHRIQVTSDRYQPAEQRVEVAGMGKEQTLRVELIPGWGTLNIRSEPDAAELWLDGEIVGTTPIEIQPMAGKRRLELRKIGWQSLSQDLNVKANEAVELPVFLLQQANGTLEVTTTPSGASVTANGKFQGQSPLALTLAPGRDHELKFSKAGFQTTTRSARVSAAGRQQLAVRLRAEYGLVFITSRPADAQLRVDGKLLGTASRRLRLTTRAHRIEISKQGYDTYTGTVTPATDTSKRLNIRLTRGRKQQAGAAAAKITTPGGQVLRKIPIDKPVRIQMGSSRGESGRRSNESQRTVELTRTFYISEKEVTNADFLLFKPNHQSGNSIGSSLNEPGQPVVSVSWDDAARYANWLSEKENLPPVYREENGKMLAIVPLSTGYRLPTEAEWVFVSRYGGTARGTAKPLRYPWGTGWPPPEGAGNYADRSAAGQLQITLQTYNDGYRVSAPAGQFPPNKLGIYDLGGNVSEWVHDYYDAYLGSGTRVPRDPAGPAFGRHHVIRGASWKHGAMTELRLSYRDYADKPRSDVGFRVARYANNPTK